MIANDRLVSLIIYLSLITYKYGLILSQPYSVREAETAMALLNTENDFS